MYKTFPIQTPTINVAALQYTILSIHVLYIATNIVESRAYDYGLKGPKLHVLVHVHSSPFYTST